MARSKASTLTPGLVYQHKMYGNDTPVTPARLERIWAERKLDQNGDPYGVYWAEITLVETDDVCVVQARELRRPWQKFAAKKAAHRRLKEAIHLASS